MKSLATSNVNFSGDSYGGKTMATKMLAASLQAVAGEGKRALTCLILNPKAMQIEQLYGHFEKDEWKVRYYNNYLFCLVVVFKNESIHYRMEFWQTTFDNFHPFLRTKENG